MEKVENIAKYILSLDKNDDIFINKLITLQGRECYEGNVRLNKYLHIMQMVYFAMTDKKLFSEDMYAFDNGVIVDVVMNNYLYLKSTKESYSISNANVKTYIEKMFNIKVNDEVCLDESYLFEGETMFTYNGVTDLDTMCDVDLFRIDNDNYEFNISFNASEYNGIISFECDLKKYL